MIVLPFISIIDQTANELKSIFKERDVVLEHHSNVVYEECSEEESYCKAPKLLATENWDYPIIVTTAVQFLNRSFPINALNVGNCIIYKILLSYLMRYRHCLSI